MSQAMIVPRGCGGSRTKGGIYAELGLGPNGKPIEDFLFDPPIVVNADKLGLSSVGVKLIQDPKSGVWHIFDICGAKHYPNVADWIEETRRFGLSRRLPKTLDFAKLTEASRIVMLHSRAWIVNHAGHYAARTAGETPWWCPCDKCDPPKTEIVDRHILDHAECCASLWWDDVEHGEPLTPTAGPSKEARRVRRTMPAFTYEAYARPFGLEPKYKLAMFGSFPIGRIAVVRDPENGTHEDAAKRARAAKKIPVDVEDQ